MAVEKTGLRRVQANDPTHALALASMSDDDKKKLFADLKAEMEPDPADPDEEKEGEECSDKAKSKGKDKKKAGCEDAKAEDTFAAGYAAATERNKAVFASEHFKGREARACGYLNTTMAADEIIGLLATDPKIEVGADDGLGGKILAELKNSNANVDAGVSSENKQQAASPMAKAVADINKRNGF